MVSSRPTENRDVDHDENARRLILQGLGREERPAAQGPPVQVSRSDGAGETTQGMNAPVTLKGWLFVLIGEMVQIERYTLKNVQGHWLTARTLKRIG